MDEQRFDDLARSTLLDLEERLMDVDPDDVEVSSSDGVVTLELRDGVRVVINSHRAALQIWMAAVSSAWKFSYDEGAQRWRTSDGRDFHDELGTLLADRVGVRLP